MAFSGPGIRPEAGVAEHQILKRHVIVLNLYSVAIVADRLLGIIYLVTRFKIQETCDSDFLHRENNAS